MAFCWKFCRNMEVIAVYLLLLFFVLIEANNCNVMKTGETIVSNPENKGEYHCMWRTTNPCNNKINCTVNIPSNSDEKCTEGSLSVQFAGEDRPPYCGSGTFFLEGIDATIKFDLPYNSRGNFKCTISTSFSKENKFDEYNCNCGWKKVTRIVGGNETGINEYPMMGGLVDSTVKLIYCGCTIISPKYVVTAAHCIEHRNTSTIGVIVGEHDVTTGKETNATKIFHVSSCTKHPYYKDHHNDIAVCKIIGNIEYSAEVGPVCLPFQHRCDSFGGDIVTALGWGLTSFAGAKSDELRKVDLNVINLKECKKNYLDENVTDKNICTSTSGKDTCQMDSGGPVLWRNPTTHRIILVGITSVGSGCASNIPAINTRTGAFTDWIECVTGEKYCKVE